MVRVEKVYAPSIANDLGLGPGTELISVNGRPLHDFLDWEFLTADERFVLVARLPDGEEIEFDIERPEGFPLGVTLEPPRIRRCGNRCDFCFVDGLPEGLRDTLYVRDDDYRLSFRHGNFATLTNLKPWDLQRIIEYRLSPLYVSVHATDPIVRRRLLRNPRAPEILDQLGTLARAGLQVHTQIVLQPGVNDGAVLEQSLADLWSVGPAVLSVSVVPVGLTEFSKHRLVREPTGEECRAAVATINAYGDRAGRERGSRWAFGSDELYLVADLPLPPAEWYGTFEQVENGVGSVRYLQQQIAKAQLPALSGMRVGVVTGMAMADLMPLVVEVLTKETGLDATVIPVENTLFGPRVTTAGLLPGRDIRRALVDARGFDLVLVPAEALNEDQVLIDDISWLQLQSELPVPAVPSHDFVDALIPAGMVSE